MRSKNIFEVNACLKWIDVMQQYFLDWQIGNEINYKYMTMVISGHQLRTDASKNNWYLIIS